MAEAPEIAISRRRRTASRSAGDDADPFRASSDGQTSGGKASIGLDAVKADPEVQSFIRNANRNLGAIGYTEHGFRQVCSEFRGRAMRRCGHDRDG